MKEFIKFAVIAAAVIVLDKNLRLTDKLVFRK